jgi:hypothetical protein
LRIINKLIILVKKNEKFNENYFNKILRTISALNAPRINKLLIMTSNLIYRNKVVVEEILSIFENMVFQNPPYEL